MFILSSLSTIGTEHRIFYKGEQDVPMDSPTVVVITEVLTRLNKTMGCSQLRLAEPQPIDWSVRTRSITELLFQP
jgi:hypothetical protein